MRMRMAGMGLLVNLIGDEYILEELGLLENSIGDEDIIAGLGL